MSTILDYRGQVSEPHPPVADRYTARDSSSGILVVDDTPDRLELMEVLLSSAGYRTFKARDGREGLDVARRNNPLLVISDVMMPDVSGIELCRSLRADSRLFATPVLLVSARCTTDECVIEGLNAGADDYIAAPYEIPRLMAKVTRLAERARFEKELRESEERYALAARGSNDGLWDWDLENDRIYFSPRWKEMLGFDDEEIGTDPAAWLGRAHPDDAEILRAAIDAHVKGDSPHLEVEHRMLHRDGTFRWMLCRGTVARDRGGRATRMAGTQTDITQRKTAEEQLLYGAIHDALTGLSNRALFMDRLEHAVERAKRNPDSRFAVIFLDIDRFKLANDSLGHGMGDRLLIEVSRRLQTCIRAEDTIARLGGDEFAILLEAIRDAGDATRMAERIQKQLSSSFNLEGNDLFTSASMGIALGENGYDRADDALRDANIAMHRAKSLGKARHVVFDVSMHYNAVALFKLETDLRRMVEREEYRIHYQPIVALDTTQVTGFEALVRWQHPERGILYPEEFITMAEETGIIIPVDRWVLREACLQSRDWQRRFPQTPPLAISVNLSAKQFSQPDLVEFVRAVIEETGIAPASLKLEITESVLLSNAPLVTAMLEQLKGLGVELYLDDFGTGYSSLSYLHRFPIDVLKIDRSFVSNMRGGKNSEITRAIMMLARSLGMGVVAEGVETRYQVAELRALLCGSAQGYLFSEPVEKRRAEALITAPWKFRTAHH